MTEREEDAPGNSDPAARWLAAFRGLPAGWYRDRADPKSARYWDGETLSLDTRPVARAQCQAPPSPPASLPTAGSRHAVATYPVFSSASEVPSSSAANGSSERVRRRPGLRAAILSRRTLFVACALAVPVVVGVVLVELGKSPAPADTAASASTGHSTTTTTFPSTTTTTKAPPLPADQQSSADEAANALVSNWSSGNWLAGLTVATPQAVRALFADPYQSGQAIDRGCGSGAPPVTCTFGPPGNANPGDAIYSLTVSKSPQGGWYVSSVQVER
jgi:hypothetical protein